MARWSDLGRRALATAGAATRRRPVPVPPGVPTPRVAVIGSGFGGLGMAIRLQQAGITDVTVFEKADRLGGTWRDNTYPGSGCDVPSHLYSLSFAPNPGWTRRFPEQAEILGHLERTADDFDVRRLIRFGAEVTSLAFDDDTATWTVALADGTSHEVEAVVAATGQLNRPYVPALPGLETFAGPAFHSARWDHDLDLTGRHVGVVGIGASAIQFVPAIAEQVGSLTLFQRSVNYVAPKPDGPIGERSRWILRRFALARLAYRASVYLRFEWRFVAFKDGSRLGRLGQERFRHGLRKVVTPGLPESAVVPDDPLGCRRILISNDWYPTLHRPHVRVVTDPIDRVEPDAVVAGDTRHPVDTLIFGTGFRATDFLAPIHVTGRVGKVLADEWCDGARAHLGITVAGFPNLFMLYGPNTNLGHNSIIFMLERQIGYALRCIRRLAVDGLAWVDVRPEAQAASNTRLDEELRRTVWGGACHSWYKTASGRITNNWSTYTYRYWWRTRRPDPADFEAAPAPEPPAPAVDDPREQVPA
ncbi:MAG TPA: NAD(P)/FAD-dependent oxidoreductase [Acidimicrobiales bacterium]|nr:NAD(P)/FAD-dependent oxidoreductase [Acidimicrobiales bacterium]